MASAIAIDGNSTAVTTLTFASGVTLATHTITFAIFKYESGSGFSTTTDIVTSGVSVIRDANIGTLTSTVDTICKTPNNGGQANTGDITADVTASGTPNEFSVYVYGIPKP